MKTLNVMLKPASSLCNMRCLYCFYADEAARRAVPSYGMMTEGTADMLIERVSAVLDQGDAVQYIFQGGEPTLRGLAFFERFAQKATEGEQLRVSFSLQTNGLLLDDAWCDFLLKYHVLVGVSLDLLPECHDKARKDAAGEGTYTRVTETIALLRRRGVPFNVLCTLTDEIAARPKQVWQRLLRLDVAYVQFTPCLGDEGCASYGRLSPHLFAEFYIRLFEFWYDDYKKGRVRSVKLFDDVVNLMVLGRPTACGMDGVCRPQLVIEADGSAYPCDFYCTDAYRLGNIMENSLDSLMTSSPWNAFATRKRATPALCHGCRYARFCGGGCQKMQKEVYISADDTACGYQKFLDDCGSTLFRLAEEVKRKYFGAKH